MAASRQRQLIVAAAVLVAVALIIIYAFVDPEGGMLPRCTFKALTGWDCPGCGSQRAFHALLHGRVGEAWRMNPALFVMVPLAAAYGVAEMWPDSCPRLRRVLLRPWMPATIGAGIILWTVGRNLF